MSGTLLRRRLSSGIMGYRVASGFPERAHQPIQPGKTDSKCCKVQGHDMPSWNTLVQDVGGGGGTTMHRQGVEVPRTVENTDPPTVLWGISYCGIDEGTHMAYAWNYLEID